MLVSNGTESTRSTTIASNLFEYIVKSDKSASQIRNPRFQIGRRVQLQVSDLGFKMQDSSDFKFFFSHRCSVDQAC